MTVRDPPPPKHNSWAHKCSKNQEFKIMQTNRTGNNNNECNLLELWEAWAAANWNDHICTVSNTMNTCGRCNQHCTLIGILLYNLLTFSEKDVTMTNITSSICKGALKKVQAFKWKAIISWYLTAKVCDIFLNVQVSSLQNTLSTHLLVGQRIFSVGSAQ